MSRNWMWIACAALLASAGCQASPFDDDMTLQDALPWMAEESPYSEPASMIIMWTDAVYKQSGAKPVRGFGGRIYFYDKNSNPVAVDGQLTVYGYDDDAPSMSDQPHKKFVFTREQFTKHYSETDLGASYSVWLPWEELGGPQRRISLYPIFTTAAGNLVRGEPQSNILPGKTVLNDRQRRGFYVPEGAPGQDQPAQPQPAVRQIHYEGPLSEAPRRHTELTIPRRMADRLKTSNQVQQRATQERANAMLKKIEAERAALQRRANQQAPQLQQAPANLPPGVRTHLPQQQVRQAEQTGPAGAPGVSDRFRRNSLSSANFTGVAAGRAAQEAIPRPQSGARFSPGPLPAQTGPTVRPNPSLVPTTLYR